MAKSRTPKKEDHKKLKELVVLLQYLDSVTVIGKEIYEDESKGKGKIWIFSADEKMAIRKVLGAVMDCK